MKRLAALLIVGILLASNLTGCALKPVEAPVTHAFSDTVKKLPTIKTVKPVELPESPKAKGFNVNGIRYTGFDDEGMKQLQILREASYANKNIIKEQSLAMKEQHLVQKSIIMSGKVLEQRANYLAFKWAIAETELQEEQRDHQIDNVLNRTLVIILALLLI